MEQHELRHHLQHQGHSLDGGDGQAGDWITCNREEGLGEEAGQQHQEGNGEVRHHHLRHYVTRETYLLEQHGGVGGAEEIS